MINMGELFAYPIIKNPEMERVQVRDDELPKYTVVEGDLLFARQSLVLEGAGKCSFVALTENPTVFESHIIRVRLNNKLCNSLFYYYFFNSNVGAGFIQRITNQVAAAGIRGSDLEKLKVIYPPLHVQRKIAAILSSYDDLIENNTKRIALLEKAAEEIYREWFVRLRYPSWKSAKLEKGLPEGWEISTLNELIQDILDNRGVTPKKLKSDWVENGITALSALNVKKGKLIRLEDAKKVSERLFERWMKGKNLDRYDILLTSEAPLGELYIFVEKENYILSQRLFAIRANPERISPIYLYFYLSSELGQHLLLSRATGATVSGIRQQLLRKVEIILPTKGVQHEFTKIVKPILCQIDALSKGSNLLRQSRDLLLSRLISGKLPPDDLDIHLPASMVEEKVTDAA